jgi:hypothetical protein
VDALCNYALLLRDGCSLSSCARVHKTRARVLSFLLCTRARVLCTSAHLMHASVCTQYMCVGPWASMAGQHVYEWLDEPVCEWLGEHVLSIKHECLG